MKTEFSYTEEVKNSRAFNFIKMTIGFDEEIALLRNKIWRTLGVLRTKQEYRDIVNDNLLEVRFKGLKMKSN